MNDFYGLQPDTLDSLILEFLPPLGHTYISLKEEDVDNSQEVTTYLFLKILNVLRNNAGFHIPKVVICLKRDDPFMILCLSIPDMSWSWILTMSAV